MNKQVGIFSIVAIVFSWIFWVPIIDRIAPDPFQSPLLVLVLFFLGAYGPTIAGIVLTGIFDKKEGLKKLFRRAIQVKVGWKWLLLTFLVGPLVYASSIVLLVLGGADLGAVNYGLLPWIPVVFIVPIVFGPLAEEFGWRGFALPRMNYHEHPIRSSIIIGFVWALWHAPLFWAASGTAISGFPVSIQSVALFFAAVIGSSFLYTWLFKRTDGSLFIAIFLHLSMNASGTIMGMLYPEMDASVKLSQYRIYTLVIWVIVFIGLIVTFVNSRRGIDKQN